MFHGNVRPTEGDQGATYDFSENEGRSRGVDDNQSRNWPAQTSATPNASSLIIDAEASP